MRQLDVIVPIYNTAPYLRECLDSILKQGIPDMGIILVDDGSTDGSGDICDLYAKTQSNIQVIHQENKGVMQAICAGISFVESEYVTVVDSDDWLEAKTYQNLAGYMKKGYDIISFPIVRFFSQNNYIQDKGCDFDGSFYGEDIAKHIYPTMMWNIEKDCWGLDPALWNKLLLTPLFKKYVIKARKLNGNFGQDVAVIYPLMKEVRSIVSVPEGRYYHRQRTDGVIAPYILDDNFAGNIYNLYSYLMNEFEGNEFIRKQIDYFYTENVRLRLRIYGEEVPPRHYLFPFGKIDSGCDVVLYGAGNIGKQYRLQLEKTNYCNVVAWVDKNKGEKSNTDGIRKPEIIPELDYDYIVIAIGNRGTAEDVKNSLLDMGVNEDKIIWCIECIKV